MGQPTGKPIERYPHQAVLPFGWHATHNYGQQYRVKDKVNGKPSQDSWESVAADFGVDVEQLIFFNFLTTQPDEVNWYLHHHTGCNKVSPSGNNWMFSNSANPGIIYIPPQDDTDIDFEAEEACPWVPSSVTTFMKRLVAVSGVIPGHRGERIQKLAGVIREVGYPACKDLWYYNDMNVVEYCDFKMKYPQLREMTLGKPDVPFDGDSGLYRQSGPPESRSGKWRIHAVNDLFDQFSCGHWTAKDLEDFLWNVDELMYRGWHAMSAVSDRPAGGGGASGYDQLVYDFIHHVSLLSEDDNNLYSAFRP
jgi:hypothetical protein